MNTPVITALATHVPPAVTQRRWNRIARELARTAPAGWAPAIWRPWFDAYRTGHPDGPARGHGHTRNGSGNACGSAYQGPVPVESGDDLSGLAARAAGIILTRRQGHVPAPDVIMFCHSCLNEHVSTTTAGRLGSLAAGTPFAFALSQQQGASVFTALRLACDLFVAEPASDAVLIVAAEKWRPPFSRQVPRSLMHGDGAGALLLERGPREGRGLRVLGTVTQTLAPATPAAQDWPVAPAAFAPVLARLIDTLLSQHRLSTSMITHTTGHPVALFPAGTVLRYPQLMACSPGSAPSCYLGAADIIVRLSGLPRAQALPAGSLVLAWGIGPGGFAGCSLLQVQGAPGRWIACPTASCP